MLKNPLARCRTALWLIAAATPLAVASDTDGPPMSIPAGVVFECNFYGQWGLKAAYADSRLLGAHPRVSLAWTTSRLSTMAGSNKLKKDNFLAAAAWHFAPQKTFDPCAGMSFGFTRFDREDEVIFGALKNTAPIVALDLGFEVGIIRRLVTFYTGITYSFITSSTVYPLGFVMAANYDFGQGVLK
jgi:hypothetical protein